MERCADCRYLVLINPQGEVLRAPVDFRVSGTSVSSHGQGTVRCSQDAFPLAERVAELAGSPRAPGAVVEVLWTLRDCDLYRPVSVEDDLVPPR